MRIAVLKYETLHFPSPSARDPLGANSYPIFGCSTSGLVWPLEAQRGWRAVGSLRGLRLGYRLEPRAPYVETCVADVQYDVVAPKIGTSNLLLGHKLPLHCIVARYKGPRLALNTCPWPFHRGSCSQKPVTIQSMWGLSSSTMRTRDPGGVLPHYANREYLGVLCAVNTTIVTDARWWLICVLCSLLWKLG